MAQQNVIVKLSLKDQDVVRRALEQLGADGEKALKRIEAASREPSAGLKALSAASDEVRGSLGNLAGSAGAAGTALQALGPGGLMAAAGLGAALLVLGKLVSMAREAGDFFAQLGDDAERAGTSASKLAVVQGVFIANAASMEEANSALVRLRATIDDAMSGNDKAQQSFQNVGISMQWLAQNGGDTVDVLLKIAQHGGLTAGQMNDLTGKIGNALVPAMQELGKVGVQSNQEFDALTKEINESKDKIELLDRQMQALSMQGAKVFLDGVVQIKQGLMDLEAWFLSTAEANAAFWKRLGQAKWSDWMWGDPIKDAINAQGETAETIKKQQEDFKAIVAGQVKIEQTLRNAPTPYSGSISPGGGGKQKKSESGSGPEYVDIVTGAPHTPTEDELYLLAHKPVARPVGGLEEFQDAADKIQKRNDDLMANLQRSWLQASDQRVALINFDRDQHSKALDDEELSEEQLALARLTINETADKRIADAQLDLVKTTDKAKESAFDLKDTFQGFGQVASSAFEDAIVKGEKFSDVLNGLAEDLQRLVLRNTMNKLFDIGMKAGTSWVSSLFGATASGPSTAGTPMMAQPATFDTAGWNAFLAGGNAYGNAFDRGNVIPFARGGVVHRPTLFPMARGMGLMGEAGPEAVMPLTRLPSGKLGVASAGAAVVNNVQVINNHPGARVSSEESKNDRGGMNLTVVIDAVEQAMAQRMSRPGTNLNRALATASSPVRAR